MAQLLKIGLQLWLKKSDTHVCECANCSDLYINGYDLFVEFMVNNEYKNIKPLEKTFCLSCALASDLPILPNIPELFK